MGKKKLQGADGINFQMQLTIKGLETVTFPKETLTKGMSSKVCKFFFTPLTAAQCGIGC